MDSLCRFQTQQLSQKTSKESIGGFFSLELKKGKLYHPAAIALNTGRNCLEYILRCRRYRKVYIPYYTCSVVLSPLLNQNVSYSFYHIDEKFEMVDDIVLHHDEALIYTNYFGLKQPYTQQLASKYGKQLIVDNTLAFYAKALDGIDTFYTCRKFFGVPDGAYLYTDAPADFELEQDVSYDRMRFLLKRIDLGPEAAYLDFREESRLLAALPIKKMSKLTSQLMTGLDYLGDAQRRRENYSYLHHRLAESNRLSFEIDNDAVPMVYPYLAGNQTLRQKLIDKKIYVATYWPNVLDWCGKADFEYRLAKNTCFLPVDQRYGLEDMERIVNIVKQ